MNAQVTQPSLCVHVTTTSNESKKLFERHVAERNQDGLRKSCCRLRSIVSRRLHVWTPSQAVVAAIGSTCAWQPPFRTCIGDTHTHKRKEVEDIAPSRRMQKRVLVHVEGVLISTSHNKSRSSCANTPPRTTGTHTRFQDCY